MPSPLFPVAKAIGEQSTASDLKKRLDWGEPALTIIDIRSRKAFNDGHIMGAVSIPAEELVGQASRALEYERDVYLYGVSEEQSAEVAAQLRAAGYENVAVLKGGLKAWQAVQGAVEGLAAVA